MNKTAMHIGQSVAGLWNCLWKRYAAIIITSALCAWAFSYCIPDEYAAQVKIADEYKVTDLLVGLSQIDAVVRDMTPGHGNQGTDNIDVYSYVLDSDDFIDLVSQSHVDKYGLSYLQYLRQYRKRPFWEGVFSDIPSDEELKEIIHDNINYNVMSRDQTLEIQVLDQDPDVASCLLKEVVKILREQIEHYRVMRAVAARDAALIARKESEHAYKEALQEYAQYADSHNKPKTPTYATELNRLQREYQQKNNLYQKCAEELIRTEYLVKKENRSFVIIKNFNLSHHPLTPRHWVYALVFAILASLGCLWHGLYRRRKATSGIRQLFDFGDWFSPWSITILIWTGILAFYYIQHTLLYPITEQFYYCLFLWLFFFLVCSFITYILTENRPKPVGREGITFNSTIFKTFFIISMIITPLYVYRVMQIVLMFTTDDLMNNIRMLALYGEGYGFLNYSNVINQSLFIVALWAYPRVPLWQVVALTTACLLNALAIMEKGTIFFVFICIIFVLFEKKVIKVRSIALSAVLMLGFFYIFNLVRAEEGSDYQENETLLDFMAMYVLSPPVAFCQLSTDVTPQFGTNTFQTIYLFLNRFGADVVVKQKLQEFVWVPIPTNVYTIFQPFFVDFGYKGVAFFGGVYGVVSGWLYRLFRNGNNVGACLYTFMAEALILQFYQENIFFSMVFVLQFTVFTVLFTQKKIRLVIN